MDRREHYLTDNQTQPILGTDLDAASYAFNRHMFQMQSIWRQLTSALGGRSASAIEVASRPLANAWDDAQAAIKQLEHRVIVARDREESAKRAFHAQSNALSELLRDSLDSAPAGTELHHTIYRLGVTLGVLTADGKKKRCAILDSLPIAAVGTDPPHDVPPR